MKLSRYLLAALICPLLIPTAWGQGYPQKPIRLVVPYPPGGVTDLLARAVGPKAAELLGQQVIVDNRGGAGGTIGANNVAKSPPDGYVLLVMAGGHTLAPNLYAKLPYDVVKDFAPISILVRTIYLLVIHPSIPAKSVKELIALAKARPGTLSYASAGIGNLGHLSAEMFSSMANIKMTHVPYKGDNPAIADLLGGQVALGFFATSVTAPHIKAGKLRALAVTSAQRTNMMPAIPTIDEAGGLKGYDISSWMGVVAPAGTPAEIVNRLNATLAKIVAQPDFKERLAVLGFEPAMNTPNEFSAFIKSEVEKFAKLAKAAGVKPE